MPPATPGDAAGKPAVQAVQGGWYTGTGFEGVVKSTPDIATLSQLLLDMYLLNPKSYKYIQLAGENYSASDYPDLLDEANWGLQYLLTSQQADGSFPAGIKNTPEGELDHFVLLPSTPEATAYGIMALSQGAIAFKSVDLSLSVRFVRAAEKGWLALKTQKPDAEDILMASGALKQLSDSPEYAKAFAAAEKNLKSVSAQTALMLGSAAPDIPVDQTRVNLDATDAIEVLPLLVALQRNQANARTPMSQWVTNLFGYQEVPLVRDPKFAYASRWSDPLQWMASKTGDVATRMGQHLSPEGLIHGETVKPTTKEEKAFQEQEAAAHKRLDAGISNWTLSTMDKAYAAYALALLNQSIDVVPSKSSKSKAPVDRDEEPYGAPKGFFPKLI